MTQVENLKLSREFVRNQISEFPEIINGDPLTWWHKTARLLIGFRNKLEKLGNQDLIEYFHPQIQSVFEQLQNATDITPNGKDDYASLADYMIMKFSMQIASPFEAKNFIVEGKFLPLNQMINNNSDRFRARNETLNGEECIVLQVKHPTKDFWQEIPLPKGKKVWHKGGPARVVLDIVANSPISMQENEFPWNDYDTIVAGGRKNKKAALNIGVDADGIEYMGEDELNFTRYCAGRDTTQNQVCLGAEGIYYSTDAFLSAVTGHTRIENEYVANKAIYGFDKMTIQGENLAKPRGLMRLIKAVVEGKVLSFDHIPFNSRFDLGTNSLFLAKRWSKKEQFPVYLQRMFYLLKQMNQTRPGEKDIFDTLERVHTEYPFFDFDSEVRFPIEVVRWKARKLIKQIDREMGWKFRIPTGMEIDRTPGDNIPIKISLDGFNLNEDQLFIETKWADFLERSRKRTLAYQAQDLTAYEKLFRKGVSDTDALGTGDDDLVIFGNEEIF